MSNPWETEARQRKAIAIADMLDAFSISSDQAADLTAGERLDVATAAGVNTPSAATWDTTVAMLRAREECRVLVDDPFAGLS